MKQYPTYFSEPKQRFRIATILQSNQEEANQHRQRLRLVSIGQRSSTTQKNIRKQVYPNKKIHIQDDSQFNQRITFLRKDANRLQREIAVNSDKRMEARNNLKINHYAQSPLGTPRRGLIRRKKNNHNYNTVQAYEESSPIYFPFIEKYAQIKQYYQYPKSYSYKNLGQNRKQYLDYNQHRIFRTYDSRRTYKKMKKVFNAVLFTIYLRTYNQRMRLQRKSYFINYFKQKIQSKLLQIKQSLVNYLQPFLLQFTKFHTNYIPIRNQDETIRTEKVISVKKLAEYGLQCINKFTAYITKANQFSQTLYYLCKHGNYSCLNSVNSSEQLSLMCISQCYGYMRGDKYLQKSALISLLFVKILLFNILFKPQSISFVLKQKEVPAITDNYYANIKLVGTVLYELFISVQDELLEKSSSIYVIGNWQKLQHKFNFKVAESMTVQKDFYRKKEVISGLIDHKYVIDTYKAQEMYESKGTIKQNLQMLRQMIARHHAKIRQKCFTKSIY